jgi:hypothetical protein
MPPEPSQVPVGPSPDSVARQRLQIHGIREMPAGYDAEVAELFRDLRSASSLSEADLAQRLATRVEVVQALEQGAIYALPSWAETCRVVNGYGAMLNLDVRPLLRRIYAQLEAGIVELSPKPIPDVPTMAPPESNGLDQNPFQANQFENPFAGSNFGTNSFGQKPVEPSKTAASRPASPTPADWPENPFAKPRPAQSQAAPKQAQPQAAPQNQPQWPRAQPAPSPQQNAWPKGPGTPLQAGWPNAAPQAPPQPMPQGARPNAPLPQAPQKPQAPWTGNSGTPLRPTLPQGQGQPRPQQQRPPQQAKMPPQPARPAPQPHQADATFEGGGWQQPGVPKHPTEADLEAAWQQPGQPNAQARPRPQAAPPPPLPVEEPEKPRRKRALLKWGIVLLLLAIMAVGGWLVLGHFKGHIGFQSSKPAALDPDDPRSHKADKLPSPSQGPS